MFDQMFVIVQILSNTIKHDQTKSNKVFKQNLVTKQSLIVFDPQTFPIWTGLYHTDPKPKQTRIALTHKSELLSDHTRGSFKEFLSISELQVSNSLV